METIAVRPELTNLNHLLAVLLALAHDRFDVLLAALEVIEVGMIAIFVPRDVENLHKLVEYDTLGGIAAASRDAFNLGVDALYGGKREARGSDGIRAGVRTSATRDVVGWRRKASEEPGRKERGPGEGGTCQVEEATADGGGKEHGCCCNC